MKFLMRNLIITIAILLLLSTAVGLLSDRLAEPEDVSVSRIAQEIRDGNARKLTVRGEELTLELQAEDTRPLRSTWRGDDVTQTLLNLDVPADRLAALDVDFRAEGAREWIPTLVITLLPILLIGVFLW